ncbi:MAG: insulinase family protein [Oscillospiraceae bacterium]|nr:insulinase family protein [Oscillospiraceae bacterium]
MDRQTIKGMRIREEYIKIKHPTGLTVLLYPMQGYSSAYALFGTKYGSIDRSFKTQSSGEFITVPDGIAHFLEHKLFENEDGDAFSLFAKTGASANAYTSFDRTCYLFSCTDNFEQSLDALLSFVRDPYFTEETVKKEQGIIGQEIRMYRDDPHWRSFFGLLSALYKVHPVNIDIAGTEESIAQITSEILFDCYNTFYNLNNMALAIAGNFDPDAAMAVINKTIKADPEIEITRADYAESAEIAEQKVSVNLEVSIPLFTCGYKLSPCDGKDALKKELECAVISECIAGEDSEFYRRMYDGGLINSSFSSEIMFGNGYFILGFSGESREPEKVFDEIKNETEKIKARGLSEEDFTRSKKKIYGMVIREWGSVQKVAGNLITSAFSDTDIYDRIELAANLTLDGAARTFSELIAERSAISIVFPK